MPFDANNNTMDVPAQSSKIFTITETKQLLAILMAPRTQTLFKDHKQHGTVWNYVYKCMKAKLPRFAKNTRQCYKKYVYNKPSVRRVTSHTKCCVENKTKQIITISFTLSLSINPISSLFIMPPRTDMKISKESIMS